MRKVLLLATLAMLGVLLFAPAALAQSASAGAEQTPDSPCPLDIDEFPLGTSCEGDDYVLPDGTAVAPTITPGASDEPCDGGPTRQTPDGTKCVSSTSASSSATGSASSSATASSTATASASPTASASASVLPETGGSISAFSILPLALLVSSGILAFRLVRRS